MPVKAPITPAPIEGWTFSLTPYGWVLSLNGSNTVKGRTTDVDAGFFDILEHTQFPKDLMELAALGEARYGRFALLTDIVYLKAGLGASITRSRGTDAINGTVGASAGLKILVGRSPVRGRLRSCTLERAFFTGRNHRARSLCWRSGMVATR